MKFIVLVAVFNLIFLAPINFTEAQESETGGFVTCSGTDCSACNLVEMANTGIIWLFGAALFLFTFLMVVAGFGLVTSGGNPSALEDAKSKFKNAFIGLAIIMSAWLVVNTIMVTLVKGDGVIEGYGPWTEVRCQTQTVPKTPPATSGGEGGVGVTPEPAPDPGSGQNRIILSTNGIAVNKRECPVGVKYQDHPGGCTSVDGLNSGTMTNILALRSECGSGCRNFTITGGSELGHSGGTAAGTHGGGDKFDLRTSDVHAYIMGPNFRDGNQGSRAGRVNISTGVACVREDVGTNNDHWDCKRGG